MSRDATRRRSSGSATTSASPTTPRCTAALERGRADRVRVRARRGVAAASVRSAARRSGGCTARSPPSARRSRRSAARPRAASRDRPTASSARSSTRRGAGAVFWNRRYGGPEREVDAGLKDALRDDGLDRAQLRAPTCCSSPGRSAPGQGTPFSVFTPFWRACRSVPEPRHPLPAPDAIEPGGCRERRPRRLGAAAHPTPTGRRPARDVDARRRRPRMSACASSSTTTSPTTTEGTRRAGDGRDVAPLAAPALGRAQPLRGVARGARAAVGGEGAARFLTELGWREFAWHVLFHAPDLATRNWRAEFDAFPWPRLHPTALRAWQEGRTGMPLVDAGMRELWATGTMHNRVRMVDGVVPHEEPAHRLAPRRAVVLGHARRRRRRHQPVQLAVGRRLGRGCRAVLPRVQPRAAGEEVRPDGEYMRRWVPEVGTDDVPRADRGSQGDPRSGARRLRAREGDARLTAAPATRAASRTSGRRRPRR